MKYDQVLKTAMEYFFFFLSSSIFIDLCKYTTMAVLIVMQYKLLSYCVLEFKVCHAKRCYLLLLLCFKV